jgi:thiol:disulfide interchange protein DsbD
METTEILPYLSLSFGFGAISLLTPCVFPLIPITVSYFLKRQADTHRNAFIESLVYSLGIVVTFTLLGVLISVLFGAAKVNQLAANPYLNLGIGFLFLFFAFNLMGFFEIQIPSWVLMGINRDGKINGIFSTLMMSFTFTLTTFSCTMPFLGTVLISASKGDWFFPVIGMLGYSVAFAIPFFILSLFPAALTKLPKSGNWMIKVKAIMGFLEIAASFKFFSNVDLVWNWEILSRDVFLVIQGILFIVLAIYLWGLFQFPHEFKKDTKVPFFQKGFSLISIVAAIYFFSGLSGIHMGELEAYIPPRGYGKFSFQHKPKDLQWIKSLKEAKQISAQTGKPIFIDFTGFTCVNCRWMEQNVFTVDSIKLSLSNYILLQLYTDGDGKEYEDNQAYQEKKYGTIALPLYVIIDTNENVLARFEGMTRDPLEFKNFLLKPFQ